MSHRHISLAEKQLRESKAKLACMKAPKQKDPMRERGHEMARTVLPSRPRSPRVSVQSEKPRSLVPR